MRLPSSLPSSKAVWVLRRATSTRGLSRSRIGRQIKQAALDLPAAASRALTLARYLPAYLQDPGLRRQWRLEDALERSLRLGSVLPPPTGAATLGSTERVIEVPWVLSRLGVIESSEVLDTGSAFAPHTYRRLLRRIGGTCRLHLADIADCDIPGATAHRADIRALPFENDRFDAVICISTLEHIGMDNHQYGIEDGPGHTNGDLEALRELGRVARTDGSIYVTVPAGIDADHDSFRQYSPATWHVLVEEAGLVHRELEFFAHDPATGWEPVPAAGVERQRYGSVVAGAAAGLICARLVRPS